MSSITELTLCANVYVVFIMNSVISSSKLSNRLWAILNNRITG